MPMRRLSLQNPSPQPTPAPSSTEQPLGTLRLRERLPDISAPVKSAQPSRLTQLVATKPRILDFDIETRLVGFHKGFRGKPDGSEPISIACSWIGSGEVQSILLNDSQRIPQMMEWFLEFYNEADIVVGHYVRKFDLPILNTACIEWGMDPLSAKKAHDTKLDLIDFEGISKSQENLGEMLRLAEQKYHMNDARWRRSARITPGGQKRARKRAESDVIQNISMHAQMKRRGLLRPPRVWDPR